MNKGLGTMPQDDANLTDLAFINRQLHATIEAMRVKLEAEHQARDDRIAQAHAVIAEEHRGLQKATPIKSVGVAFTPIIEAQA